MAGFNSANFYDDNKDIQFYVDKYIDWTSLVALTEYDFKATDCFQNTAEALDTYKRILEMVGDFAANEVAPHTHEIDQNPPFIKDGVVHFPPMLESVFQKINTLELHGMCLPRSLGGMNCPYLLFLLSNELLSRADLSVTAHHGFHGGMAMAMLLMSIWEGTTDIDENTFDIKSTRFQVAIEEIVAGKAWGSMDITEPAAGSDMGSIEARGVMDDDGDWRVTGQKIFITSGHAKYHFVIARTEEMETDTDDAFAGLKGLSLFLVPAYEIDGSGKRIHHADFVSLEEKLGHHGSATVMVSYDNTPAELIGNRGEGFKYMLLIMNNARIGVGVEAIGIAEAALRMARAYAAERRSMGKPIEQHEMIADYLDEMEIDIIGLRALLVKCAFHEEMGQKIQILHKFTPEAKTEERKNLETRMESHRTSSRLLTPLLKYLASEKAVEICRRNLQIHGGYGYSKEYGAEKLLRDAIVLPIYEGTSEIQSLMAMKDNLMGIIKDPKAFLRESARVRLRSNSSQSKRERRVAKLRVRANQAKESLMLRMVGKKLSETRKRPMGEWGRHFKDWNPKKDLSLALLHAKRLTNLLADAAIGEELLLQSKQFPDRGDLLERFLERAESRSKFNLMEIKETGSRLISSLNA